MDNDYPVIFGIGRNLVKDEQNLYFEKDDFLLTKSAEEYNVGDIVVYQTLKGDILTDKISSISDDGKYYFENGSDSNVIFEHYIKGDVIFTIPHIAPCIEQIESTYGTIIILMAIVLLIETPHFIDLVKQRKKEKII